MLQAKDLVGIGRDRLRAEIVALQPREILVKVKVMTEGIKGEANKKFLMMIPHRARNDAKIVERHTAEMEERGLRAVRSDRPDSGIELVSDDIAREINIARLTDALFSREYVLVDIFWQEYHKFAKKSDTGRAIVWMKFVRGGEGVVPFDLTERTAEYAKRWLVRTTYGNLHLWGNLRVDQATGEVFRLDTINCNAEHEKRVAFHKVETKQTKKELRVACNTIDNNLTWEYQVTDIE